MCDAILYSGVNHKGTNPYKLGPRLLNEIYESFYYQGQWYVTTNIATL